MKGVRPGFPGRSRRERPLRLVPVNGDGAFEAGADHAEPWVDAHTYAAGIRVPAAIGDFLILRAVRDSGGFAIAVDDETIEAARVEAAREEGILLCPEGAATYAAFKLALADGRTYAVPDDVKRLAIPVLAHRIVCRGLLREGQRDREKSVISRILEQTAVPR